MDPYQRTPIRPKGVAQAAARAPPGHPLHAVAGQQQWAAMLRSMPESSSSYRPNNVRPRQDELSVRRIDTEVEFLMALKAQLQAGQGSTASKERAAAATVAAAVDRSQRLLNAHAATACRLLGQRTASSSLWAAAHRPHDARSSLADLSDVALAIQLGTRGSSSSIGSSEQGKIDAIGQLAKQSAAIASGKRRGAGTSEPSSASTQDAPSSKARAASSSSASDLTGAPHEASECEAAGAPGEHASGAAPAGAPAGRMSRKAASTTPRATSTSRDEQERLSDRPSSTQHKRPMSFLAGERGSAPSTPRDRQSPTVAVSLCPSQRGAPSKQPAGTPMPAARPPSAKSAANPKREPGSAPPSGKRSSAIPALPSHATSHPSSSNPASPRLASPRPGSAPLASPPPPPAPPVPASSPLAPPTLAPPALSPPALSPPALSPPALSPPPLAPPPLAPPPLAPPPLAPPDLAPPPLSPPPLAPPPLAPPSPGDGALPPPPIVGAPPPPPPPPPVMAGGAPPPPPPPPMGAPPLAPGAPPPPPMAGAPAAIKLKPVHWRKLQPSNGSVWASLAIAATQARLEAEQNELENLFVNKQTKALVTSQSKPAKSKGAQHERAPLCSAKRKQNISICLNKVSSMPFDAMARAITSLNVDGSLTWEDSLALQQLMPTADEVLAVEAVHRELTESGDGSQLEEEALLSSLDVAERFLFHLVPVPSLERKLQVITLMQLFPQLTAAVRANIQTLELAAAQVRDSFTFRCCLGLCLRVGNLLNRGTPRANARGFEVHVLPSLSAIKSSKDTQYSLLHFVARELKREVEDVRKAQAEAEQEAEHESEQESEGTDVEGEASDNAKRKGEEESKGAGVSKLDGSAREEEPWNELEEAVFEAEAQEKAVRQLKHELRLMPDANEGTELLGSIEVQIGHIRSELYQVRAELSQLPPLPACPVLLDGFPRIMPLDHARVLLSFATDEVCVVHWVMLPRWRRPPTFHSWGKATVPPTRNEVLAGCGHNGTPPIACGSVVIEVPEEEIWVMVEGLPRRYEVSVYAIVEDCFGWAHDADLAAPQALSVEPQENEEHGDSGAPPSPEEAAHKEAEPESLAPMVQSPWHQIALARMRGVGRSARPALGVAGAASTDRVDDRSKRVDEDAAAGSQSGKGDKDEAAAGADASIEASVDPKNGVEHEEEQAEEEDGEKEAASARDDSVSDHIGHVVVSTPPCVHFDAREAEQVPALERARHQQLVKCAADKSSRDVVMVRVGRYRSEHGVVSCARIRAEVSRALLAVATVESMAKFTLEGISPSTASDDHPRPLKMHVDGLHTRFLLEGFLGNAQLELEELQGYNSEMLVALEQSASYLGLQRPGQSPADHIAVLSVLKDFVGALTKCALENTDRARVAAKEAQAKLQAEHMKARLSLRSHPDATQNAAHASAMQQALARHVEEEKAANGEEEAANGEEKAANGVTFEVPSTRTEGSASEDKAHGEDEVGKAPSIDARLSSTATDDEWHRMRLQQLVRSHSRRLSLDSVFSVDSFSPMRDYTAEEYF